MKPITFENLRRLVGAGRKKKEKESSFKRSDSFKRISIRKSYLENRGKGRNLKPPEKPPIEEESVEVPESLVIGYGQWIKCMRAEDYEHLKELTKTNPVPPTPPPRKKYSAPSTDSSLEILKLDTSPVPVRRRMRKTTPPSNFHETEERSDSGLSISLGRVWMDAPLAMANAPRSLELPRPSASVETDPAGRRVHHSLESALKERRDDKPLGSRRFHNYPSRPLSPTPFIMPNPSAICRTLSSTTQTTSTSKTTSSRGSHELLSSSKDSGFSFSISIPRLSDLSPTSSGGGFFCKKKPTKPKLSVSREGYFKRTNNSQVEDDSRRSSGRKKKSTRKKSTGSNASSAKSDMYQVVINRPPRCLQSLKLDPMIFVPPERRKPSNTIKKRYEVQEIRDYCSPRDVRILDSDSDEGLYECISGDFSEGSQVGSLPRPSGRTAIKFEDVSDFDADTEDEAYAPVYRDSSPQRRPVRRKKSTKKAIKYVAKPSIHRAPSTLKRNKKLLKKGTLIIENIL